MADTPFQIGGDLPKLPSPPSVQYGEAGKGLQTGCGCYPSSGSPLENSSLTRNGPNPTNRELNIWFEAAQATWEASDQCKLLHVILQSMNTSIQTSKVVAFACGSIERRSQLPPVSLRSEYQHALILTLRRHFNGDISAGNQLPCYAQDPDYTTLDESVLAEHRIAVVDDPEGYQVVDDSSVVLSISPDVPVRQKVFDLARPAILIWDRMRDIGSEPTVCR